MELFRKLGKGSFGTVYKARSIGTENIFAVKVLKHSTKKFQRVVLKSTQEFEILKLLQHPNIVKMFGTIEEQNDDKQNPDFGQVFEYVDGDLNKLINSAPLAIHLVKHLSRQILAGIEFCHLNKIIHRDIKPENILITKNAVVKIGDFGLAIKVPEDPNEEMSCKVGTLWYKAPEMLLGVKQYGTISDMWSVGCTIVQMITGQPLFSGKSREDQRNILAAAFRPRVGLQSDGTSVPFCALSWNLSRICENSSDLFPLLLRMLSPDPNLRITATDALKMGCLKSDPNIPQPIYFLLSLIERDAEDSISVDEAVNGERTHATALSKPKIILEAEQIIGDSNHSVVATESAMDDNDIVGDGTNPIVIPGNAVKNEEDAGNIQFLVRDGASDESARNIQVSPAYCNFTIYPDSEMDILTSEHVDEISQNFCGIPMMLPA